MKNFFLKTYFFWVVTRIIFIAAVFIDLFTVFSQKLTKGELLINMAVLCYIAFMTYNTVIELQNKIRHPATKYIVGVLSILIAISIFYVALTFIEVYKFPALLFVAWISLLGIFDLLIMNRQEEEVDSM